MVKKYLKKIPILWQFLSFFYYKMIIPCREKWKLWMHVVRENALGFKSFVSWRVGVKIQKREIPIVVSLTTIPKRIAKVHLVIESILSQSLKPDYVVLWLPQAMEDLVTRALKRQKRRGLQVRFCEDIRSYKKIIPTLQEYPHSIIVTADDDVLYPQNWLENFYKSYQKFPHCVHCYRAHLMKKERENLMAPYSEWDIDVQDGNSPCKRLFFTGNYGVFYPPTSLPKETLKQDVFMDICQTGDDIWLNAMIRIQGFSVKKVSEKTKKFYDTLGSQQEHLWLQNMEQNDINIKAVFDRYAVYSLLD